MKITLDEILKDLNDLWKEKGNKYQNSSFPINLDIFICNTAVINTGEIKNKEEYTQSLEEVITFFNQIVTEYHKKFKIGFEPTFYKWEYNNFFFKKITQLKGDTALSEEQAQKLYSIYNRKTCNNELIKRLYDLMFLYIHNQKNIDKPTIYCNLVGYTGKSYNNLFELMSPLPQMYGCALPSKPFMAVSTRSEKFETNFRHELNHCFGAKHSYVPFTTMFSIENSPKIKLILPINKMRMKRTIKKYPYSKPLRLNFNGL